MAFRRRVRDTSSFLSDAYALRFNASHPLMQGCVGCWVPYGNTFIDLLTREVATPIEPLNQAPRVVERHGSAIDFWDGGNAPNGVTCKVNEQLVFSGSYTAVMIHKFAIGSANTKQQLAHWHAGGAGQKTQQFSTNNAENHVLNFGGNGTGRGANFREEATNSVPRGVWQWLVGSAPAIDTGGENRRVWVDGIEWENRGNVIVQGINTVPSDTIIGGEPDHVFKGAGPTLLFALFDGAVWGREQALDFYNERFPFVYRESAKYFLFPSAGTTPVDGPPLDLQWEVQGLQSVENPSDLRWAVNAEVESGEQDLFWAIREEVARAQELVWSLREEAAQQQTLQWAIAEEVARTLELRWEIQQEGVIIVQRPITFQWALRENVADTLDAQWKIRTAVDANVSDLRWQLRESIDSKLLDLFWAVRQDVERPLELQWQLAGDVQRALSLQWQIGGVPIPRDPNYILKILHDDRLLEVMHDNRTLKIKSGG